MARWPLAVSAFAAVWLGPVFAVLASPPHGEGAEAGHGAEHGAGGGIKWLGDGVLGGPGADGKTGFAIIILNFIVLLLVLNKLLFRNLKRANEEKSDSIRLELERATKARTDAEALVKEYETKLSALEGEVVEIRTAAEATAKAEHARIIAEAHEQAEKIKAAAKRAAEHAAARSRAEIENEIAEQALARAEQAIRKSFAGPDQRRLVDAWVEEVSATQLGGSN